MGETFVSAVLTCLHLCSTDVDGFLEGLGGPLSAGYHSTINTFLTSVPYLTFFVRPVSNLYGMTHRAFCALHGL
jgi:hypothetical protein